MDVAEKIAGAKRVGHEHEGRLRLSTRTQYGESRQSINLDAVVKQSHTGDVSLYLTVSYTVHQ